MLLTRNNDSLTDQLTKVHYPEFLDSTSNEYKRFVQLSKTGI